MPKKEIGKQGLAIEITKKIQSSAQLE